MSNNELADREDNLPANHGRWIREDGLYKCSKCGKYTTEPTAPNYCPWCGIIMSLRESD